MSRYPFNPIQRRTIFEAFDEKCFYCKKLILFDEMVIDHFIPESILNNPRKYEKLKTDYGLNNYGLDNNFDINNYCNWVLSCRKCNSNKGDTIFPLGEALIYLGQIRKKHTKVIENEKKIKRQRGVGKLLSNLEINLKKGLIPFSKIENLVIAESNANKDLIVYYVNCFDALIQDKKYNEAISYIKKVLEAYPEDETGFLYYALGFCYLNRNEYRKAVDICTKSISINSGFSSAYFVRGQAYFIPYYKNFVDNDYDAYDPLERIDSFRDDFTAKSDFLNAIDDYSNTIEKNSNYPDAYYWRAVCRLFMAIRFRTQFFDGLYLPTQPIDDLKMAIELYYKQSNLTRCKQALEAYSQLIDMYGDIFPEHKNAKQLVEQLNSTYFLAE